MFKNRFGIKVRVRQGELADADAEGVTLAKTELRELLAECPESDEPDCEFRSFEGKDVYTMDETGCGHGAPKGNIVLG